MKAEGLDQLLKFDTPNYQLERSFLVPCLSTLIDHDGYMRGPSIGALPRELHATANRLRLRPWWHEEDKQTHPYLVQQGITMTDLHYVLRAAFGFPDKDQFSSWLLNEKVFYKYSLTMIKGITSDYIQTAPTVFRRKDSLRP